MSSPIELSFPVSEQQQTFNRPSSASQLRKLSPWMRYPYGMCATRIEQLRMTMPEGRR